MCMSSKSAEGEIKEREARRSANIGEGMKRIDSVFAGFDPQYYEGVRQASLGQLVPQVERQYRTTSKQLGYGLANKGLLNSSGAREAGTALEFDRGLAHLNVANQANEVVNTTRQRVEGQKQNLTNQLIASEDPNMAAQQAVGAAASISAPSLTAPLGNLFQNFANTYLAREVGRLYSTPQQQSTVTGPKAKNYFTN